MDDVLQVDVEDPDYAENEVYKNLRAQNVKPKVAVSLIELYEATDMSPQDLDDRAIEMLRSLPLDHAAFVIKEVGIFLEFVQRNEAPIIKDLRFLYSLCSQVMLNSL